MQLTPSEYGHTVTWAPVFKNINVHAHNYHSHVVINVPAYKSSCYVPGGDFTDIILPSELQDVVVTPVQLPTVYNSYPVLIANSNTGSGIPKDVTTLKAGNSYVSETQGLHNAEIVLAIPYVLMLDNYRVEAHCPLRILTVANVLQIIPTVTSFGKFVDSVLEVQDTPTLEVIYV